MKRLLALFLALMLFASLLCQISFAEENAIAPEESAQSVRGMFVSSQKNTDFPSVTNLSAKALCSEIAALTDYAAAAGYNAIFFEVRADGGALYSSDFPTSQYLVTHQGDFTFFDPLREMLKAAKKKNLSVYAVVDPYGLGEEITALASSHPAVKEDLAIQTESGWIMREDSEETVRLNAKDLARIAGKYPALSGILLENLLPQGNAEAAATLLQNAKAAISGKCSLGAIFSDDALENAAALSEGLDLVIAATDAVTGFDEVNFSSVLSEWKNAVSPAAVLSLVDVSSPDNCAEENAAQVFVSERLGAAGTVCKGYRALSSDETFAGSLIASMRNTSDSEIFLPDYDPPQYLTITRPASTLTTTYSAYFITGTSDTDETLTMDGSVVDRRTEDGVFGVFVELVNGTNVFTFRQGSDTETVRIVRSSGTGGSAATTTKITAMTPRNSAIVFDKELEISCIAPANASVTATFGGKTVSLTQKAAASTGVPATFTGTIEVPFAKDGAVEDLGPITYTVENTGAQFTSNGSVFSAGKDAVPTVTVNTTSASVYYDDAVEEGSFKAIYKKGVTDRVLGAMGEYYELSSGWIKKSDVNVNPADAPEEMRAAAIRTAHDEKAERFVIEGAAGLPYTFEDREDGTIQLTLYGISLPEKIETESELFSSIEWSEGGDETVSCVFTPSSAHGIWAMDVFPSESGTVIYARRTPKLSDEVGKPLSGISVVIDPGHGGTDPGALSVTGGYESELNFANATMLRYRLEQLGASVTLTRNSVDDTKSLYERVGVGQEVLPDFFLSLHHNSIVEYADGYKHSGVEAYYYEDFGKATAAAAVRHISQANYDRQYRSYDWGYYIVAKNRFAPSILCEIGFVPNPVENRYINDETEIYKTANALSAALLEVIESANS